jgi:hypothetical protein
LIDSFAQASRDTPLRRSERSANATPMAMTVIVATRLAGAVQLMHVPTTEKVSLAGAVTRFIIFHPDI